MSKGYQEVIKRTCLTKTKSRRAARLLMQHLHPEINWKLHFVHHRDGNPFNNNMDNLEIMEHAKHVEHHLGGINRKATLMCGWCNQIMGRGVGNRDELKVGICKPCMKKELASIGIII